jgi:hypothetical protein
MSSGGSALAPDLLVPVVSFKGVCWHAAGAAVLTVPPVAVWQPVHSGQAGCQRAGGGATLGHAHLDTETVMRQQAPLELDGAESHFVASSACATHRSQAFHVQQSGHDVQRLLWKPKNVEVTPFHCLSRPSDCIRCDAFVCYEPALHAHASHFAARHQSLLLRESLSAPGNVDRRNARC